MSGSNKLCYEESLDDQLLAIISDDAIQTVISRRSKKQKTNTARVLVRCFKGAHNAQVIDSRALIELTLSVNFDENWRKKMKPRSGVVF